MSEDMVKKFHTDLRKSTGEFAIFLGAGSSYDYGIATMDKMANILHQQVIDKKCGSEITAKTQELLVALTGILREKEAAQTECSWNIEELLTRLHQLREAVGDKNKFFVPAEVKIGEKKFTAEEIKIAENDLITFMVKCAELGEEKGAVISHGGKSIAYIADFIELMGEFQKIVTIFTTNIDLCVEAAIVKLSQHTKGKKQHRFHLIDGFSTGILPTFDIANFAWKATETHHDIIPVYYWKLHGSIDWTFSIPLDNTENKKQISSDDFGDEAIICKKISPLLWEKLYKCGAFKMPQEQEGTNQKIVIFPTPIKYSQTYTNPYMDLYEAFRRTLEEVELLLVVGTSFPDQHIKSVVRNFVQRRNTLLYVVDPVLSRDNIASLLGESDAIQEVIKVGFKDFIDKLKKAEELEIPEVIEREER